MRYPKKKPLHCSVTWWEGKGYYCYNTQQKLGDDCFLHSSECIACRAHYEEVE